jgi:hypothetical protein
MLTVTDDDQSLAAELNLFLDQQPVTDEDRSDAARANALRMPETWLVRSRRNRKPIGRIHFTAVDCLYATKYGTVIHAIEESVADAIRWIAPIIRHARTGEYDGTETIVRRFKAPIERPRAITECGAKATAADYNPIAALSELINGRPHEMCPACRAKLEEHHGPRLSEEDGRSTTRQHAYIRQLLDDSAMSGRLDLIDTRDVSPLSSREASAMIDRQKALQERGWKGKL